SPGLPAEVIARRPDIAGSEAQLRAAHAAVIAARAALLPSTLFTAAAGRAALAFPSLSSPADSSGWSLSRAQRMFDSGRLRNQKALSDARRMARVEQNRNPIYGPLQEEDPDLDRTRVKHAQEERQAEIVVQAQQ